MKSKDRNANRRFGSASRKSSKTTATRQIPTLSDAAISTIDRYLEELKNMPPDDKNAPIEFLRIRPADQIENMKAVPVTTKYRIMEAFVAMNFRGIPTCYLHISPEDPFFPHIKDPQAMESCVKDIFLNDAKHRDLVRDEAKKAAGNRKLRDKYFDVLRRITVEMPFETSSYQIACAFSPISTDDFAIAEFLNGVKLYLHNTQVTLQVLPEVNPLQEEAEFFFTEDQLLSWIDEIEAAGEVTGSAAS